MASSWSGFGRVFLKNALPAVTCIFIILAMGCTIAVSAGQPPYTFTETVISVLTPDSDQELPFIFESGVSFIDFQSGSADIRIYDPVTGSEDTISGPFIPTLFSSPSGSGDKIVWESFEGKDAFICLYNISSGERIILSNLTHQEGSCPVISGDIVAYSDYSGMDSDIFILNIRSGETLVLDNGTETTNDIAPDVSGDTVVWQGLDPTGLDSDIFLWKSGSTAIRNLTPGTPDIFQEYPDIDGNYVVWQGYDCLNNSYDIYIHDLTMNETRLLTPGTTCSDELYPKISGDHVVWQCLNTSTNLQEIVFYSISSGESVTISTGNHGEQFTPGISGDRVVWAEMNTSSGRYDIHMATCGIDAPLLFPSFTANETVGRIPFPVQFQDHSSGDPTGWWWDLGDGNQSREQNPCHVYTRAGKYPVILIVSTPYRREGIRVECMIVAGSPPEAGFIGDPTFGNTPLEVQFSDLSSGNPSEWSWNFGDNNSSSEKNPTHMYTLPGIYNVTLWTGNEFGNNTIEKKGYITVVQGSRQDITFPNEGISLDERENRQVISLNDTALGGELDENDTSYRFTPVSGHNIAAIRINTTGDGAFSHIQGDILEGDVGTVEILTSQISDRVADPGWELSSRICLSRYPGNGRIIMTAWPGATQEDLKKFREIATGGNPNDPNWSTSVTGDVEDVAFTARFQCENLTGPDYTYLLIGINPQWINVHGWRRLTQVTSNVEGSYVYIDGDFLGLAPVYLPSNLSAGNYTLTIAKVGYPDMEQVISLEDKRDSIRVIRISDDGTGEVLPVKFLYHDSLTNLDIFSAESPNGLSTFGIVTTSHKGSPIQVFYLTLSKMISSSGGGGGSPGGSGGGNGESGSLQSPASAPGEPYNSQEPPDVSPTVQSPAPRNTPPETIPGTPATTLVISHTQAPLPESPLSALPSAVSLLLIRNLAIIFGIILALSAIILRLKGRI